MSENILKLHLEKPGTPYFPPKGEATISRTGHAWFEVIFADGHSMQAGFGPAQSKTQPLGVKGRVFRNDGAAYGGEPAFTATYEITAHQANILRQYIDDPSKFGFNTDSYHALSNSCVDFVANALRYIGMNPEGYDGSLLPMDNAMAFSRLINPLTPHGGRFMPNGIDIMPLHWMSGAALELEWDRILPEGPRQDAPVSVSAEPVVPEGVVSVSPPGPVTPVKPAVARVRRPPPVRPNLSLPSRMYSANPFGQSGSPFSNGNWAATPSITIGPLQGGH